MKIEPINDFYSVEQDETGDIWLIHIGQPVVKLTKSEALKLRETLSVWEIDDATTKVKLDSGDTLVGEEADKYLEKLAD